uniref:Uncharacterized protein n=1 Tax=Panagrolaimus sp. ES5 TaxID=591445 RepID=A0AC34FJ34_9BILA
MFAKIGRAFRLIQTRFCIIFSLCKDCRNYQYHQGNYNIHTDPETGKTSVTIVMCQECVTRNIASGDDLDTRIPLQKEEASKTTYAAGELASLKNQFKRKSGFEKGQTPPPSSDDEETIRYPPSQFTPQNSTLKRKCPDAPKANRQRKACRPDDEETCHLNFSQK